MSYVWYPPMYAYADPYYAYYRPVEYVGYASGRSKIIGPYGPYTYGPY